MARFEVDLAAGAEDGGVDVVFGGAAGGKAVEGQRRSKEVGVDFETEF